jgi:predicted nuclease of restriction endonuclease-like (RecB) superfamily
VQESLAQITWYHHITLIEKVKNLEKRQWYIKKTIEYGWSRNVLLHQIELDLYQREGKSISNFDSTLPSPQSDLAASIIKDPYKFDFLSLGKEAHEREIEKELVKHIEKFLLELGAGFAFVGKQYQLTIGKDNYFIDLLFYHLKLRCYVVVELKSGSFKPEYVGKLNFYLSAIDDILKHKDDNPSIGILLCKDRGEKIKAEYSLRDIQKPIGLAEYKIIENLPKEIKTLLPSIEELETELNKFPKYSKDTVD